MSQCRYTRLDSNSDVKMKTLTAFTFAFILCLAASYTPRVFAQVADAYCSTGETLIETALEFRRTGHPVDHAMQITRSVSNPQARQFLQLSIRDLFRNPGPTERMLRNGQWKEMCIHFVQTGDLSTYRPSANPRRDEPQQEQFDKQLLEQSVSDRSFTIPFAGMKIEESRKYVTGGSYSVKESSQGENPCLGFIEDTSNPYHVLHVESPIMYNIKIWTESSDDTTLFVVDGDGSMFCDGGHGRDALLELNLIEGTYNIWVGTHERGKQIEYELFIRH